MLIEINIKKTVKMITIILIIYDTLIFSEFPTNPSTSPIQLSGGLEKPIFEFKKILLHISPKRAYPVNLP